MKTMRAARFEGAGSIKLREARRPTPGPGEALVHLSLTTIRGTDVHILRGEYSELRGEYSEASTPSRRG
jgi:threonine dehydrogenase-like Zn-dependent dehydrogenase